MANNNIMPDCIETCEGCFAVGKKSKVCTILTMCEKDCSFYKTKEQYKEDQRKHPITNVKYLRR